MNPVTVKCPECWALLPVEEDAGPGHEYECENCGAVLTVRSTHPIELFRSMYDDVVTPDLSQGQSPIQEGMQVGVLDHVRIVDIIDEVKLWRYGGIDLAITLTG